MSDVGEFQDYVERIVGERRKVIGPNIMKSIEDHLDILNQVETHLGCAKCRHPLTDGRCPKCQPTPPQTTFGYSK